MYFDVDQNSFESLKFIVDVRVIVCIRRPKNNNLAKLVWYPQIQPVNNTPIKTHGKCSMVLNLEHNKTYKLGFVDAKTNNCIQEPNFIRHFNLLVHIKSKRLKPIAQNKTLSTTTNKINN